MDRKLVPIDGRRVRGALKWRRLSERDAVKLLGQRGVATTRSTLNAITGGHQKTCQPDLREGLAILSGSPVSAKYLGGEEELPWVAVPRVVSPKPADATDLPRDGPNLPEEVFAAVLRSREDQFDMNERALPGSSWRSAMDAARAALGVAASPSTSPFYELTAWSLAHDVEAAWSRDVGREAGTLYASGVVRLLLSLVFWRRALVEDAAGGNIDLQDMDEFANLMAAGLRLALKPWLQGGARVRLDNIEAAFRAVMAVAREIARSAIAEAPRIAADPETGGVSSPETRDRMGRALAAQQEALLTGQPERQRELEKRHAERARGLSGTRGRHQ